MADRLGDGAAQSTVGLIVPETTEPSDADAGTLSFDESQSALRIKVSSGWRNVPPVTGNPYVDPPSSVNAFNDEFDSGSADLADRGWFVRNATDNVMLTYQGDIQPWRDLGGGIGPASSRYYARRAGSVLYLQFSEYPDSKTIQVYRPITLQLDADGGGGLVYGRILGMASAAEGLFTNYGVSRFNLWANSGGVPDQSNRITCELVWNSGVVDFNETRVSGGSNATATVHMGNEFNHGIDLFGVRHGTNITSINMFCASTASGCVFGDLLAANIGTAAFAGFSFQWPFNTGTGDAGTGVVGVDFARYITGRHAWIGN